jgi:hypothetical protein
MREYQFPDLSVVAFTGAAWLAGLAVMLIVQAPPSDFETSLFARTVLGTLAACGSIFLARIGFELGSTVDNQRVAVKEAVRQIDRPRRAA